MINITDAQIKDAEEILINGNEFDKIERVPFIKKLDSIDLLAVPGSGKTTALLAKLLCLSKQLPFNDGSGILILSHTNAAVEEIEKQLKPYCPNLFVYPNFVGTIQGFINRFLVYPYYSQASGSSIVRIDDGSYFKEIEKALSRSFASEISYIKNNNKAIFYNARFWFNDDGDTILSNGISSTALDFPVPPKWIQDGSAKAKKDKILGFIRKTKADILSKGILLYDDCYFLAKKYLLRHQEIASILQLRFKFLFIDEMQDLEGHQIELIDDVFHSSKTTTLFSE